MTINYIFLAPMMSILPKNRFFPLLLDECVLLLHRVLSTGLGKSLGNNVSIRFASNLSFSIAHRAKVLTGTLSLLNLVKVLLSLILVSVALRTSYRSNHEFDFLGTHKKDENREFMQLSTRCFVYCKYLCSIKMFHLYYETINFP